MRIGRALRHSGPVPDSGDGSTSKSVRVLVVHPSDELYGADRVLLEALRAIPEGTEIEVWLPDDLDYPERRLTRALVADGRAVHRMPLPVLRRAYLSPRHALRHLRRLSATSRAIRKSAPDVVYVNTAALALVLLLAKLHGARTILHLHEHTDGLERRVLGILFRAADRIIVVSEAVGSTLGRTVKKRSSVVYNGFDAPPPVPAPEEGPLVFVLASRWNSWKGHEFFLTAWSRLQRTDVRLLILGAPPAVGESVDVVGIVARLPNRDTVEILGERSDVRSVLDVAHVVVVPSTKPDPLPTIALEAAGAGRAALVSRSGGLPEIVLEGITGWTIEAGRVEEWTRAIESLDRTSAGTLGRSARERYRATFSRSEFARRFGAEFEAFVA